MDSSCPEGLPCLAHVFTRGSARHCVDDLHPALCLLHRQASARASWLDDNLIPAAQLTASSCLLQEHVVAASGGTASEGIGAFSLLQLVHDEPQRQLAQVLQGALREALLLADGHRRSFEELRCVAACPPALNCCCWQMGTCKAVQTEGCSDYPTALRS